MNANVIEVKPFNITKIELVALRGPKGDTGYPSPEEIQTAVDAWLDDHPEATTTVQDGAITTPKLADEAVTVDKLSESLQSLLITDTASGSIASFSDGSDGIPIKGLEVNIEPKQDLHGYANPWPGGGGKNLYDASTYPFAQYSIYNTEVCWTPPILLKAGTYTFSCSSGFGNCYVSIYSTLADATNNTNRVDQKPFANNGSLTYTASADVYVRYQQNNTGGTASDYAKVSNSWQTEAGSSKTTYEPYSNICPITGWDEVKVTRTGKNLLSSQTIEKVGNTYFIGDSRNSFPFYLKPGTYTFSSQGTNSYTYAQRNGDDSFTVHNASTNVGTFTVTKAGFFKIWFYYIGDATFTDIQLELGSTATAYEPYQGTTLTIPLGSTVYGGTLDVSTGVLTVEKVKHVASLSDSTGLYQAGTDANRIGIYLPDSPVTAVSERLNIKSNIAKASTAVLSAPTQAVGDCCMYSGGSDTFSIAIFGVPKTASSAANALAWLVDQGCEFVYNLATPTTVQLTPQQITTLLGENNVWSDAGSVSVDYVADTKLYINKMIANALNS